MNGQARLGKLPDDREQNPIWRWRGAIIVLSVIVGGLLIEGLSRDGSDAPDTPADRSPYAEVACEDFARDAGMRADDGETSNITAGVYTVQMYDDGVRVGTCVVEATGAEEWTLVAVRPR